MLETEPAGALAALFAAMNARDPTPFVALLDPDAVFRFPGTRPIEGSRRIEAFLKILFHKYPRLSFEVGRVVADGHRAAAEWTNSGEDRDGAPYGNAGVTFIEMRGGRVVYLSDTFKDTSLFVRRSQQDPVTGGRGSPP